MSQLSDFVVCSTNIYIWSSGVYITSFEVENQCVNSSDHINTIFKHCQLINFIRKILDLRPKSVCAVQMIMYVDWTCINVNRNDVYA